QRGPERRTRRLLRGRLLIVGYRRLGRALDGLGERGLLRLCGVRGGFVGPAVVEVLRDRRDDGDGPGRAAPRVVGGRVVVDLVGRRLGHRQGRGGGGRIGRRVLVPVCGSVIGRGVEDRGGGGIDLVGRVGVCTLGGRGLVGDGVLGVRGDDVVAGLCLDGVRIVNAGVCGLRDLGIGVGLRGVLRRSVCGIGGLGVRRLGFGLGVCGQGLRGQRGDLTGELGHRDSA